MARPLKLKPTKDPASGQWRVNVIAKLSLGGSRERRFFPTQAAALAYIEELKARRDNLASVPALTITQLLDAAAALEILADHSITLSEAARIAVKAAEAVFRAVTVKDLFREYKSTRAKNTSTAHRRDTNRAENRLAAFADRFAHEITRADIATVLTGLAISSRDNVRKVVRAVFNYGKDHLDCVKVVPVRSSDFSATVRTEVIVLAVAKIRSLLENALNHDLELLPLLLIETFCGVRPAEAMKLLSSDIDLLRAVLTIRASVSKTKSARTIKLRPGVLAWFEAYHQAGGKMGETLVPCNEKSLRQRLRKIRYLSGYRGAAARWTPGALRDAFCSYHLNHFDKIELLMLEAGHTSFRITRNHYLGLVTAEAAAEFWNLMPPAASADKIVQFATA